MIPVCEGELIDTIKKVSPSVVNINTVRLVHDYYMNIVPLRGMGSGVIIDENGMIVTNNHIVEQSESIEVTLFDGKKYSGKLLGTDRMTDIAVVKIEGKGFPYVKLGDSNGVQVGQIAIAIGNPFGFFLQGPTVTVGVISALNRTIQAEQGVYENLIQTDAHINPGNSGGPLVNIKGEVIGINSANIPFAQGIGFSIPASMASRIVQELIKHGKVIRPWLGILGVGVNEQIAEYYELPSDTGVLVTRVFENSPAYEAGVAPGDMIITVDHKDLKDMNDLTKELRSKKVGDFILLTVLRGRRKGQIEITLGESP
ncbi:Trypsin-like serine protease, typically periplasmic [Methanocella conradii HZ254]|uniref:Trypsin-like serine protease, typically periplasmic n=1 Tax=Methanocella conradii (strain DSM 24694 / JCM 17849 / CGMCC 1.5162 / HZ254) TaxID=1041930 RepID=H8I808_METCZ|nr:trypsin-like peptidase domain-containing protein [Methanocella conradii]AFD00408.1 Trypsin-like serine protease, typically periplasmic [Methanocella conradii HZ254]MDI6895758.1 trypsin-like peptidase domain-containing protein [Methanocella conradii]